MPLRLPTARTAAPLKFTLAGCRMTRVARKELTSALSRIALEFWIQIACYMFCCPRSLVPLCSPFLLLLPPPPTTGTDISVVFLLVSRVQGNSALKIFDIEGNSAGNAGTKAIVDAVKDSEVTTLGLAHNAIGDEGGELLIELLETTPRVTTVVGSTTIDEVTAH